MSIWNFLGAGLGALAGAQDGQDIAPYFYPGQEELGGFVMNEAMDEYNRGPQQFFPGSQVAALDQNVIDGQNAALGVTGQQQQMADLSAFGAANLIDGGAGRVEGIDLPNQVGFGINPELESAVTNPIMRQLTERTLPSINLNATSQGAFGGTRHQQMMNNAASDATERMADSVARANLQARGQDISQRSTDINAMLQGRSQDINQNNLYNSAVRSGLGAVPSVIRNSLVPAQTQMDIGNQRTGYEQQLINADMNRFNFEQQAPYDQLTRLASRLQLAPPPGGVQGQQADLSSILGGALWGLNLPNVFTQDQR